MKRAQRRLPAPCEGDDGINEVGYPTPSTAYGTEGSIGIFLQAEEPTDPTERANWLPAREGPFYLVTRHYSPQVAILTGDWLPSAIVAR